MYVHTQPRNNTGITGVFKIIEGQFPAFQRFHSSKIVLETVESCFSTLNYFENAISNPFCQTVQMRVYILYVYV